MIVGLDDLKAHLRVEAEEEDADIQSFGLAAEAQVRSWVGRPIYASHETLPAFGSSEYRSHQMHADEAVKVAIKLLAARMYAEDRAGGTAVEGAAVPPLAVRALLAGHRVFYTCSEEECSPLRT